MFFKQRTRFDNDTQSEQILPDQVLSVQVQRAVCALISDLFFGKCSGDNYQYLEQLFSDSETDWQAICDELEVQSIPLLFSDYLIDKNLPDSVYEKWKSGCFDDFDFNIRVLDALQWLDELLTDNNIPYIVIKGTCAAMLYPRPILRTQGDIDILITTHYLADAIRVLNEADCIGENKLEGTGRSSLSRHYAYTKNKVLIEVHTRFATLNTQENEKILDRWLYKASEQNTIRKKVFYASFPAPPKELNGLILLTHINQHLEEGLGLRQIIDWMMYVNNYLDDEAWPSFRKKVSRLGLEKLAITVTLMCQLYLGLPDTIRWCQGADPELSKELLDYIFECGDFGHKQGMSNSAAMVISHGRGIRGFFRNLQKRGEANWEIYKNHHWLKPFAWIYQGYRYAYITLKRKHALSSLLQDIDAGVKRGELIDRLNATSLARKK